MGVTRSAAVLLATAGIVATAAGCDQSIDDAADTAVSAIPETGSAPWSNGSSAGDTASTATSRDCPLPSEWKQPPFVDVTGSDEQPDPEAIRALAATGGASVSSDDYWVRVVRLISDDAEKPLPPIDEDGLRSADWWAMVDHDIFVSITEQGLGEVGVDICRWYLTSQVDYEATRSEITARLNQG